MSTTTPAECEHFLVRSLLRIHRSCRTLWARWRPAAHDVSLPVAAWFCPSAVSLGARLCGTDSAGEDHVLLLHVITMFSDDRRVRRVPFVCPGYCRLDFFGRSARWCLHRVRFCMTAGGDLPSTLCVQSFRHSHSVKRLAGEEASEIEPAPAEWNLKICAKFDRRMYETRFSEEASVEELTPVLRKADRLPSPNGSISDPDVHAT